MALTPVVEHATLQAFERSPAGLAYQHRKLYYQIEAGEANTSTVVLTPASGSSFAIKNIHCINALAGTLRILVNDVVVREEPFSANGGIDATPGIGSYWLILPRDATLRFQLSAAGRFDLTLLEGMTFQ
jgi:hypothetical protein